jgi:glutamate synthase (NADPH) large chain
VILGDVGKNFAAGMSGGIAYVLADDQEAFMKLCNQEMIAIESLTKNDEKDLKQMIENHFNYTDSLKAGFVLEDWPNHVRKFNKVIPKDYKRMLEQIQMQKEAGLTEEDAIMSAFLANSSKQKNTPKQPEAVLR